MPLANDDLLDAGDRAEEMVGDGDGVDQEAVVALDLDEKIVAEAEQRNVLGRERAVEDEPVDIPGVADLGDDVLGAVEAEIVAVQANPRELVVAEAAVEAVVAAAADEGVGVDRADQHLDAGQGVAERLAGQALAGREVDVDRFVGGGVIGDVEAVAAIDDVGAAAAAQAVVGGRAADRVVVERALDDLDAGQGITLGIAAAGAAVGEVDDQAFGGQRIIDRVDAGAAGDQVGAAAANEDVVAIAAIDRIVAAAALDAVGQSAADEGVGEVGADQVLDRHERVARGLAAGRRAVGQRDRDTLGGAAVDAEIAAVSLPSPPSSGSRRRRRAGCRCLRRRSGYRSPRALRAGRRRTLEPVVGRVAAELVDEVGAGQRLDAIGVALG